MPEETISDRDFFEWLDSLSDADHTAAVEALEELARELGVRVDRKPIAAHKLLNLLPHCPSVFTLN
jgi:predicted ArsR family transcriptional regulator